MPEESRGSAPGIDFNGLLLAAVILLTAVGTSRIQDWDRDVVGDAPVLAVLQPAAAAGG